MANIIFDESELKLEKNFQIAKNSMVISSFLSALAGIYLFASAFSIQSNYLERNPYKNSYSVIEYRKNPSAKRLREESEGVERYLEFNRDEENKSQNKKNLGICAFILSGGFCVGGMIFDRKLKRKQTENIERVLQKNQG